MTALRYVAAMVTILMFAGVTHYASTHWKVPEAPPEAYYRMLLQDFSVGALDWSSDEYRFFAVRLDDGSWAPRKVRHSALTDEVATAEAVAFIDTLFAQKEFTPLDVGLLVELLGQPASKSLDALTTWDTNKALWEAENGYRETFLWADPGQSNWIQTCRASEATQEGAAREALGRQMASIRQTTTLEIAFYTIWLVMIWLLFPFVYGQIKKTVIGRWRWFGPSYLVLCMALVATVAVAPRFLLHKAGLLDMKYAPYAATPAAGEEYSGSDEAYELRRTCLLQPIAYRPGNTILYRPFIEMLASPMLAIFGPVPRTQFTPYFILFYLAVGVVISGVWLVKAPSRQA